MGYKKKILIDSTATRLFLSPQEPIKRNSTAARAAYQIQHRALRTIVFDALQVRPPPLDVSSIQGLCQSVVSVKLQKK